MSTFRKDMTVRTTLKRVLATVPIGAALALGVMVAPAQAAPPVTSSVQSAAAITGVCSIYLYGSYFDGAAFVTQATCLTFVNLYTNQYPPGSITYTWYPLA